MIVGYLDEADGMFCVGAREAGESSGRPYRGPMARVEVTRQDGQPFWLHIVTDDYEGHAMLNIEALPFLIQALVKLQRQLGVDNPSTSRKAGW